MRCKKRRDILFFGDASSDADRLAEMSTENEMPDSDPKRQPKKRYKADLLNQFNQLIPKQLCGMQTVDVTEKQLENLSSNLAEANNIKIQQTIANSLIN